MRVRMQNGGARQRAWDCLRQQPWDSVKALSDHLDIAGTSLHAYVRALVDAGYVARAEDGEIRLVRDTGSRAPSLSAAGALHDWNLHPPLPGQQLQAIIAQSGLSDRAWLARHGIHVRNTTRLRQMIAGHIPVSAAVEAAALQTGII